MSLLISESKLSGVKVFRPDAFEDHRGSYVEIFNKRDYGLDIDFVQDDISVSHPNVLRGLHGDAVTWKLISCLVGAFYFVVVDVANSQWESFLLSVRNRKQVLVPPGFANGHYNCGIEDCIFHYKQSEYYGTDQFTIKWNDPKLGIWWPCDNPVLSRRDS